MASLYGDVLTMRKTVQVGAGGQDTPEILESRSRTFISWINQKVEHRGLKIQNLTTDLENGIVLLKLLETLAPTKKVPGRYYARPVIKIQKVQNLTIVFKFLTEVEKIPITSIQPHQILGREESASIALIWLLILHYDVGLRITAGVTLESAVTVLKRTLLSWINGVLPGQNVTNFNSSWKDGKLLSALVDSCQPGLIPDHASLKASNSAQNVQNALLIAQKHLKIKPYMSASELALEKPDEISLMMYLAQFCTSGSAGQMVLLAWIQQQIPDENVTDFTASWINGRALGALTNAVSGGKFPSYSDGNVEQAMIAAEKTLGVRRIVTPAKFADPESDELFRVCYLAQFKSAGENKHSVLAVPASADKVEVSDIQIPNVVGEGKTVWVELDCYDAGYGEVRAEVRGRKTDNIPVVVKEVEEGSDKYRVSFEPKAVDVYNLSILYGEQHVTGSPFSVNLYPPDPEKVKHAGTDDNSETGQDVALNFETKEAGRGKLSAKAEGEISGGLPVKIVPLGDGSFAVSFKPQFPDIYTIDVLWGKFSASAIGESSGPVALQVNKDRKDEYLVSFKPPNPDLYMVDVSWDGKPVPGSPFVIDTLPPPMPEEVECAVPIYNEPGEDAELLVDASSAGSGNIKANCSGESVGNVPVEIAKLGGRAYQVNFTPPEKDLYTLNVLFEDKHVKGSPFLIDMRPGVVQEVGEIQETPVTHAAAPDASKCVILNPPRKGQIVPVDTPVNFAVDCKDAGPGELDVSVEGPGVSKARPDVTVNRRPSENVYDVSFTPKTESPYSIGLSWFNDPIPKSPLKITAVDPVNITTFHYGKPVGVECDAEGKSGDLKAVAIHDETDTNYKVKIAKIQKGKYKLSFAPRDPGLYRVHVTMKDKEIAESPFIINYGKPPKPEAVRVNGFNSKCYIDEPMDFTIDATDAGSGDLSVKSSFPKNQKKDKSELTVTDNKNGTYKVNYKPQSLGDHTFNILWAGRAIPNSPRVTTAVEHTPDIVTDNYLLENYNKPNQIERPISEDSCKTLVGNPLLMRVTVSDELKNEPFTATANGRNTGPTDVTITKKSDKVHEVLLNPTQQDVYTLSAKVGDQEVPKSPVEATYNAIVSDPSKCQVIGINNVPSPLYVNQELNFKVLTADAGPGKLAVSADTPLPVDEAPVIAVKQSPVESTYDVSFRPRAPGDYSLNFTWDGETIPDTPLQLNASEPPIYGFGQPVGLDISAEGNLEANAVHLESNTPYKVKVAKVNKGKYKLTLEPKDPGYYHIHVFHKQKEIPQSPYVIKYGQPSQPDKVTIRDQPEFVYVDRPINFTVDCSQAGSGELGIKALLPKSEEGLDQPELKISNNKDGTYGVECVPNTAGKHSFDVTWSGQSVPDSPVNVDVRKEDLLSDIMAGFAPIAPIQEQVDAIVATDVEALPPMIEEPPIEIERRSKFITIIIGKALKLKVRPKDDAQRNGELKVRAKGEDTGIAEVKSSQLEDGTFQVYFNPPEPDYYVIDVKLNNDPVPQSPFHVLYIPAPVDEPVLETPQETVNAVYIPERPIDYHIDLSNIPNGSLSARCVGEEVGSVPVTYEPIAPESKKYKVAFVPPKPDLYHLSVFFNDKELKDSPYDIDLRQKILEPVDFVRLQDVVENANLEALPPPQEDNLSKSPSVTSLEEAHTIDDVPMEEFTIPIGTPMVVKVHPRSDEQRNGVLTQSAIGEKVGNTKINSFKRDDKFIVYFDPVEPDRYTIDVAINDEAVPRSPFRVRYIEAPIDAGKCKLIGTEDIPDFVEIGQEVNLRVDAKKAGAGNLGVSAEKPAEETEPSSMLSATPSQTDRGFFDITYIPQSHGHHKIGFEWNEKEIPKSPVGFTVVDSSKAEVIAHGKPASLEVDADGSLRADCIHKETGQHYNCKVKAGKTKGKYKISFQPRDVGLYYVHAYVKDKEIPRSPFIIRYARPSKPEAVKVIGLNESCYLGETVDFKVDTKEAGDGDLVIKTLGPDGKETVGPQMTDEKDGIFSGAFNPAVPGMHELQMTWGGKPVPKQPFPVFVRDHSKEELLSWLYSVDRTGAQHKVNFPAEGDVLQDTTDHVLLLKVQARTEEQKRAELLVTATSKETSEIIKLPVSKKDDTFEAKFVPPAPQTYNIEANLNTAPVPNTPFNVHYDIAKPDAGKCSILGLEKLPDKFQVNQPIFFQVDTRLAGDGKLNLSADGVQTKPKLEARANSKDSRIIDVTYTPTAPGTHRIKVLWSGETVPKSPLEFPVEAIPRCPNGKPIGYDLDIDAKSGDIEANVLHVDTNTKVKVKTSKVSKGKYHFTFKPTKIGLYVMHVLVKKTEIKGSPYYFIYEGPPRPEACVIRDIPDDVYIQEPSSFTVDASNAGTSELAVKLTPPSKGKDGDLKVINNTDGTWTVEHTPEVLGDHKFALSWAGKHIPKSPVVLPVKKRVPRARSCLGPFINVVPVGDDVEVDVVNLGKSDTGNSVTATAKSKDASSEINIEDREGMSKVLFKPTSPGDFTVSVRHQDNDLEGSPFLVKAVEKPNFSPDYKPVDEACKSDVEAGKEVCLILPKDESLPPDNIPYAEAVGPEGPCDVKLIDQVESCYGLNFLPTVPGDYLLHVKDNKEADAEVKSSPYKIRAIEKESDAHKVRVPEEFQSVFINPIPLGVPIHFDINTADAGHGTLKLIQNGKGRAVVTVKDMDHGVYRATLVPNERGRCELDILWNDEKIRGSPFSLQFVPVTGVNLEGETFMVGTQNKFTVDRKSVIEGKLEVYCSDSQAADISIVPADDDKLFYCVLSIRKAGDYQIFVKYNGYDVVGSPFNVHFQQPPPTGMSFSLNAQGAETSDMTATVQNSATLQQMPVNINDLFGGNYSLEFVPNDGLEYMLTIKCKVKVKTEEKIIAGSPFPLSYYNLAGDASKVRAEGEGLSVATAGVWSSFFVYTEGAGTGKLSVDISGDVFGDEEAFITALSPTKYEVKYILRTEGNFQLSVTWGGENITGSPFNVACSSPITDQSFQPAVFPSDLDLGSPAAFTLTPKTGGVSQDDINVQARARSKAIGIIPGTVTSEGDSYKCNVDIDRPGKYLIEATHKSAPLPGTPFIVKVTKPPKPENVRAFGPGLEDGHVGQERTFTIETEHAGSGKLSVNVEGPKGGFDVNMVHDPKNDRTILASYSPKYVGLYVVKIKWANEEIPLSPFNINIREQEQ